MRNPLNNISTDWKKAFVIGVIGTLLIKILEFILLLPIPEYIQNYLQNSLATIIIIQISYLLILTIPLTYIVYSLTNNLNLVSLVPIGYFCLKYFIITPINAWYKGIEVLSQIYLSGAVIVLFSLFIIGTLMYAINRWWR